MKERWILIVPAIGVIGLAASDGPMVAILAVAVVVAGCALALYLQDKINKR